MFDRCSERAFKIAANVAGNRGVTTLEHKSGICQVHTLVLNPTNAVHVKTPSSAQLMPFLGKRPSLKSCHALYCEVSSVVSQNSSLQLTPLRRPWVVGRVEFSDSLACRTCAKLQHTALDKRCSQCGMPSAGDGGAQASQRGSRRAAGRAHQWES